MTTSDNCGALEGKAAVVLAYLQIDRARHVNKAYTANQTRTNAHAYHDTWPVVINALIQRL